MARSESGTVVIDDQAVCWIGIWVPGIVWEAPTCW